MWKVSGTYQVKVKVTVDKDGNIISVEDDGTEPGKRNSSFWEDALELFEEFGGEEGAKTIEEVDQVEAVSGATISSNAIKAAVKKALQSEDPTEKPDAPAIKTADQRTRFVFSAAEPADLLITAPEGTQIRYTTDGSDPAGNSQAFVAEGTGAETAVSVSAAENATGTMILKAVAVKDGQASDVTEKELSFIQIPEVQE
ncbi:MAG: FMN-binding protein, partial [Clostridium sp.]